MIGETIVLRLSAADQTVSGHRIVSISADGSKALLRFHSEVKRHQCGYVYSIIDLQNGDVLLYGKDLMDMWNHPVWVNFMV